MTERVPRLRIAMVGLRFGRHIVDMLCAPPQAELFTVVAVCDRDAELAQSVASDVGAKAYDDLDDLLSDPGIDVVGLFTGPVGRADLVRRIIATGRDVMTTKPFERDPAAARECLEEARALGRVVHLNSPGPELPADLAQIARWRDEHDLGRPVGCRAEAWARSEETPDGSWYDDPEMCPVAPVYRIGIYLINDLVQLLGTPESVQVQQTRLVTGRPTSDNAQVGIAFEGGALATVFASFCVGDGYNYRNSLVLNYERGTVYRNVGPPAGSDRAELVLVRPGDAGEPPIVDRAGTGELSGDYQWAAFHRAVTSGGADGPYVDVDVVVRGIEVVTAMAAAAAGSGTAPVIPTP